MDAPLERISFHCVPPPIELVGGAFTKRTAHTLQLLSVNISPSLPQPPAFLPRLSNTLALVLEFHPSNSSSSSSSRSRLWWLSSYNGAETFIKLHLQFFVCLSVCGRLIRNLNELSKIGSSPWINSNIK